MFVFDLLGHSFLTRQEQEQTHHLGKKEKITHMVSLFNYYVYFYKTTGASLEWETANLSLDIEFHYSKCVTNLCSYM